MSIRVSLYRAQRRRVARRLRKTKCRIEALRCRVLLLLSERVAVSTVAERVGCARATVYRTVYRFEDLGEDGLSDQRLCAPPRKATVGVQEQLLSYLDAVPKDYGWQRSTWTLELLALQLEHDTSVRLSPSYVRALLRWYGCRRGRPRAALRVPVRGRRKVLEKIEKLVASAGCDEEVFYGDEADIDLNPRIGPTYLRRGQQPEVLTPGKNVKRYVFGAWNPRTGRVVYTMAERKNSDAFIAFIGQLMHRYRRARVLHLVLDNYIIHKSHKTRRYVDSLDGRVVLHFLPPYSPDDNPIERLWKQLHDNVTRNHQHRTIDSLVADVAWFLEHVQPYPGTQVSTIPAAA